MYIAFGKEIHQLSLVLTSAELRDDTSVFSRLVIASVLKGLKNTCTKTSGQPTPDRSRSQRFHLDFATFTTSLQNNFRRNRSFTI